MLGTGLLGGLGRGAVPQPRHRLLCRLTAPVAQGAGYLLPRRAGGGQARSLVRPVSGVESVGHVNILSTHGAAGRWRHRSHRLPVALPDGGCRDRL